MFIKIADIVDKFTSNPIFLIAFNTILVVLWVLLGTDLANIFISIITAEMVLVAAGASRRGFIAIHAKLDELIHVTEDARDDLAHIEDKPEKEIINTRC